MLKNVLVVMSMMFLITTCSKEMKLSKRIYHVSTKQEIEEIINKVQSLPDIPVTENEKAVMVTNMGTIEFEFYPDVAPKHCANFKKLANSGFYNGVLFHRVIPNFVIQGGDILSRDENPNNDGTGDAGYKLDAEFSDLHHDRGIVSTARAGNDINSAGTQFFICVAPIRHLDGQYTIFGKVTKGMNVVDKIVNVQRDKRDRPLKDVVMEEVKVVSK